MISVTLPIRTRNPLNMPQGNSRKVGIIRARERAAHRSVTRLRVGAELHARSIHPTALVPAVVTLTRVSAGKLDGDGLQASFKAIRDGVADVLGVDDGGPFVEWRYAQRKGPQKTFAIEVRIERAP